MAKNKDNKKEKKSKNCSIKKENQTVKYNEEE